MEGRKALHRHRPFSRLFLPLSRLVETKSYHISILTLYPKCGPDPWHWAEILQQVARQQKCSLSLFLSLYLIATPPILQSNSQQQSTPDEGRMLVANSVYYLRYWKAKDI